jgi:hypothetical protein
MTLSFFDSEGLLPVWANAAREFSPVNINQLRHLLAPTRANLGVFSVYRKRFDASDHAWFIAGAHKDGRHVLPRTGFHPEFTAARKSMGNKAEDHDNLMAFQNKIRELLFDTVGVKLHSDKQL